MDWREVGAFPTKYPEGSKEQAEYKQAQREIEIQELFSHEIPESYQA